MRNLLIFLLIFIIFISGCISKPEEKITKVGLSALLTTDSKQVKASMPLTFILEVKNLASETANDISVQLFNLTEWRIENNLQKLSNILPNDIYKFSWIAYSPPTPNKTFVPFASILYRMETNAKIKLRVYDNNYLDMLKLQEKERIKQSSALVYSSISKNTPIAIAISLKQPFILTEYSQTFPFVIEVKNVGSGSVYDVTYPSLENYIRFKFKSNSTIICDFQDNDLVQLDKGSRSIVCRLTVTKEDVNRFNDFDVDFTVSYIYLDKASTKIEVK